mgnify:CR=1 FL=1
MTWLVKWSISCSWTEFEIDDDDRNVINVDVTVQRCLFLRGWDKDDVVALLIIREASYDVVMAALRRCPELGASPLSWTMTCVMSWTLRVVMIEGRMTSQGTMGGDIDKEETADH